MRRASSQRGDSNLGCVIWIVLIVVAGVFLYKWVPAKIANTELHEYMVEQAKFAQDRNPQVFHKRIFDKAKELGLPVSNKDIKVEITGDRIKMRCKYTVKLDFSFYVYNWEVDHQVDRPIFYV